MIQLDLRNMGDTGFEHLAPNPKKTAIGGQDSAECGALGAQLADLPSELQEVVNAWETLSEPTRAGILAMIRATNCREVSCGVRVGACVSRPRCGQHKRSSLLR